MDGWMNIWKNYIFFLSCSNLLLYKFWSLSYSVLFIMIGYIALSLMFLFIINCHLQYFWPMSSYVRWKQNSSRWSEIFELWLIISSFSIYLPHFPSDHISHNKKIVADSIGFPLVIMILLFYFRNSERNNSLKQTCEQCSYCIIFTRKIHFEMIVLLSGGLSPV